MEQESGNTDRNRTSRSGETVGKSSKMKKEVTEKTDTPEKKRMHYEHERTQLRLTIAREALRCVFGIIAGTLLVAFVASFVALFVFPNRDVDIFASSVLSVVFSGLFGTLTLILGFIAGSNIND